MYSKEQTKYEGRGSERESRAGRMRDIGWNEGQEERIVGSFTVSMSWLGLNYRNPVKFEFQYTPVVFSTHSMQNLRH